MCDLSIMLKGLKFRGHQFVFRTNSKYFENYLNKEEELERQHRANWNKRVDYNKRSKMELPHWMSSTALKMFIKVLYMGRLE